MLAAASMPVATPLFFRCLLASSAASLRRVFEALSYFAFAPCLALARPLMTPPLCYQRTAMFAAVCASAWRGYARTLRMIICYAALAFYRRYESAFMLFTRR